MNKTRNPGSKHFVLQPLAEGVSAAIAINGGSAICNAGLIDLGGQLVAFDAFLTPQAAKDLKQAAIEIYGRPPQIVINSHYHNDHIWGNQVFAADAQIVSTKRTRELMATEGMEEFKWFSSNSAQKLADLQRQYQNTTDEKERNELLLWMGEYGGIVEALPNLAVCLPGVTFDTHLELHGTRHTAQIITFEDAHTGNDAVLHMPQAGIVFMSDLLFVGFHPYLADGNPLKLMDALKELIGLEAKYYVPGHGPVGTVEDVRLLIEYIEQCYETAHRMVQAGNVTEEQIQNLQATERFKDWPLLQLYRANIRFLCKRVSSTAGE